MNLTELARKHNKMILNDTDKGFAVSFTLISPANVETPATGLSRDIWATFDPSTGQLVTGRSCNVTMPDDVVTELPYGVLSVNSAPWLVRLTHPRTGSTVYYRVCEHMPDNSIGSVTLDLEVYERD